MKLNDWINITGGRITEGSEYGYSCYGDRPYYLSYWNGKHGTDEVSTSIVYDRDTFETYEADVFDGVKNKTYTWRHPDYVDAYNKEASEYLADYDEPEWPNVILESLDDFVEKATAILAGKEYDERVKVPLNLENDELFKLMLMAHEKDVTLNQFITTVLEEQLNRLSTETKPNSFHNEYTFTNADEGYYGLWEVIRKFPIVDYNYGEPTDPISYTYDSQTATYIAVWRDGNISDTPDKIIKVNKGN